MSCSRRPTISTSSRSGFRSSTWPRQPAACRSSRHGVSTRSFPTARVVPGWRSRPGSSRAANRCRCRCAGAASCSCIHGRFIRRCLMSRRTGFRLSLDLRYQSVAVPTGRPVFPSLLLRGKHRGIQVAGWESWRAAWLGRPRPSRRPGTRKAQPMGSRGGHVRVTGVTTRIRLDFASDMKGGHHVPRKEHREGAAVD